MKYGAFKYGSGIKYGAYSATVLFDVIADTLQIIAGLYTADVDTLQRIYGAFDITADTQQDIAADIIVCDMMDWLGI